MPGETGADDTVTAPGSSTATPTARSGTPTRAGTASPATPARPSSTSAPGPDGGSMPLRTDADESRRGVVSSVVDGDTVEVSFAEGGTRTVGLAGVDAPETAARNVSPAAYGLPDTRAARSHLAEWGRRAEAFAAEELGGASVRVVVDGNATRGESGVARAYVYAGNATINRALLDGGYARVPDSSFARRPAFVRVESAAKSNGTGLWGFLAASAAPNESPRAEPGDRTGAARIASGTDRVRSVTPRARALVGRSTPRGSP